MKQRVRAIAATSLVAAASLLLPSTGHAQGRRATRVVRGVARPMVLVGPYYRPWFYDSFYFDPYYRWYQPPYRYGGPFEPDASLRLQVTPRETQVFVDGYYAGTVDDFDGFLQRLRIEQGEHNLELYLAGHRSVQQKVYLQPGATFRLRHTMEPLAPGEPEPVRPAAASLPKAEAPRNSALEAADVGMLALRVQPGDAVVMIDGERWDGSRDADRLVVQLAPGVHRIEIRREGFRPYSSEVTVRRGETEALNVALSR